jgi:hypothetical protein
MVTWAHTLFPDSYNDSNVMHIHGTHSNRSSDMDAVGNGKYPFPRVRDSASANGEGHHIHENEASSTQSQYCFFFQGDDSLFHDRCEGCKDERCNCNLFFAMIEVPFPVEPCFIGGKRLQRSLDKGLYQLWYTGEEEKMLIDFLNQKSRAPAFMLNVFAFRSLEANNTYIFPAERARPLVQHETWQMMESINAGGTSQLSEVRLEN